MLSKMNSLCKISLSLHIETPPGSLVLVSPLSLPVSLPVHTVHYDRYLG